MNRLPERFQEILQKMGLEPGKKLLVAFSGGADSSVLAHLLSKTRIPFALAHVNYGLRGVESDADELFCVEAAANLGCKIHVLNKKGIVDSYKQEFGVSKQQAAREIRYGWFRQLCETYQYDAILTAHHENDHVETVLINLVRGTGIKGLCGIPAVSGNIYRPLLTFSKDELEAYAIESKVKFRTDSSNLKSQYLRNVIRNAVIPSIDELKPGFVQSIAENIPNYAFAEYCLNEYVQQFSNENLSNEDHLVRIRGEAIQNHPFGSRVLYQLIDNYGFNHSQCMAIVSAIETGTGKIFESPDFIVLINRKDIIVHAKQKEREISSTFIQQETKRIQVPIHLQLSTCKEHPDFSKIDEFTAYFDYDRLKFPLEVRKVQPGDKMIPLGMKGHKKISDIFIDDKVDRISKGEVFVLLSDSEIIWLIGHRTSEIAKITNETQKLLKIIFLPEV